MKLAFAVISSVVLAAVCGFREHLRMANLSGRGQTDAGLIEGTVLYEDGRPVPGATVYADPLGIGLGAVIPHADTDTGGNFTIHIHRSWFGRFAVTAEKATEDFPPTHYQFYSDGKFETVTLTSEHPSATTTIRLGPKAGTLEGHVTDATTHAPLRPCVELRRVAHPNNFISGSGLIQQHYKFLLPSSTDVLMKIYLDGYLIWYFPGTTQKSERKAIRLDPGEHRNLDIPLEPDPKLAKSGCPAPIGLGLSPQKLTRHSSTDARRTTRVSLTQPTPPPKIDSSR